MASPLGDDAAVVPPSPIGIGAWKVAEMGDMGPRDGASWRP
jgi:hypothetical protein